MSPKSKSGTNAVAELAQSLVAAQDVDRVADKRDDNGNDLLNTIDGALTKNSEVITVMTTNHVERLDRAMLRPGRLDAIITVRPPEPAAVEKLIHLYSRGLLDSDSDSDLLEVSELLAGQIPATIREVVERSKLSMLSRDADRVESGDLLVSARSMIGHLDLMGREGAKKSPGDLLADALVNVIGGASEDLTNEYEEVRRNLIYTLREGSRNAQKIEKATGAILESNEQAGGAMEHIINGVDALMGTNGARR